MKNHRDYINKYSLTSRKDKEGTIKIQYSGETTEYSGREVEIMKKQIMTAHEQMFKDNPRIKKLTTKVLEMQVD